eukprot:876485-Amphidinium_carterae.1
MSLLALRNGATTNVTQKWRVWHGPILLHLRHSQTDFKYKLRAFVFACQRGPQVGKRGGYWVSC